MNEEIDMKHTVLYEKIIPLNQYEMKGMFQKQE